MFNYKKYIFASGAGLIVYAAFCMFTKRKVDPIIAGLIAGLITIVLSYLDVKNIKSDFRKMKENIVDYTTTKNFERYFDNQQELLNKTDVPSLKNIIRLNMASAFINENRIEEGKKYLDEVNLKEFDSKNLENAILNKLFLLYRVDEDEKADAIFDEYFKDEKKNKSIFFMVLNTLRYNKYSKDGIKELSNLNMREDAAPFRPYIEIAKTIILENIE